MSELERTKQALELTREHNRKLTEENLRLRAGQAPDTAALLIENARLVEQLAYFTKRNAQLQTELVDMRSKLSIEVIVHPELLPPPPKAKRQERRRFRSYAFEGDNPLRTQWPIEP